MFTETPIPTEKGLYTGQMPDGCRLIRFPMITDERGSLCIAENGAGHMPYPLQRAFWIFDVKEGMQRGSHAHRTCSEVIIPVNGSFTVELTNGKESARVVLDSPAQGLLIPPMVWCNLKDFTPHAVCLCLASAAYDPDGYINNIEDYYREMKIQSE